MLTFKQFNHYIHLSTFEMPTIRQVWQFIQCGDYTFSIDYKDAYLDIVKHHHHFFHILFYDTNIMNVRFCHLGWL